MEVLRTRSSEVVVPEKLARDELLGRDSPVRRFIRKNPEVVTPMTAIEDRRYLELLKEPGIHKGEAAAIAVAEVRHLPLVIDDGSARRTARRLGIRCLRWKEFGGCPGGC